MKRRDFLRAIGCAPASFALSIPKGLSARNAAWRTFEVTTRVEVLKPSGTTRVWVPAALIQDAPFQKTLANTFQCEGGAAKIFESKTDAMGVVRAEFPPRVRPILSVTSRVATRNWAVDPSLPGKKQSMSEVETKHYLRATRLLPTDGIVKATAMEITRGARTDLDKARAIYEWVVENTYRNPKTRGCGVGDIRFMLESRDLSGKCADLNALYVGLARAAGLPARDVYGIRVARSEMGYKSLGTSSDDVTKAQHCRAEVYLSDYGWVPVDPADVRKVVLEEVPGGLAMQDAKVQAARSMLFGSWEMNWIAYNNGHDVPLPGSSGRPLPFLMYPNGETAAGRLDCLDPARFRYQIAAREVTGA